MASIIHLLAMFTLLLPNTVWSAVPESKIVLTVERILDQNRLEHSLVFDRDQVSVVMNSNWKCAPQHTVRLGQLTRKVNDFWKSHEELLKLESRKALGLGDELDLGGYPEHEKVLLQQVTVTQARSAKLMNRYVTHSCRPEGWAWVQGVEIKLIGVKDHLHVLVKEVSKPGFEAKNSIQRASEWCREDAPFESRPTLKCTIPGYGVAWLLSPTKSGLNAFVR